MEDAWDLGMIHGIEFQKIIVWRNYIIWMQQSGCMVWYKEMGDIMFLSDDKPLKQHYCDALLMILENGSYLLSLWHLFFLYYQVKEKRCTSRISVLLGKGKNEC